MEDTLLDTGQKQKNQFFFFYVFAKFGVIWYYFRECNTNRLQTAASLSSAEYSRCLISVLLGQVTEG